jgi:hypothetical protein
VENNLVYLTSRSGLFCSCRYMQAFDLFSACCPSHIVLIVNLVRRLVDTMTRRTRRLVDLVGNHG